MGLLEEDDESLGLMGQALDHADLAGVVSSMFNWSTTGCRYFAKCPEKGVSLHSSELR